MEKSIESFLEVKSSLLSEIASRGTDGMPESVLFQRLYGYNKSSSPFNYKDGLTPDHLLSSLMSDGYISKVCNKEFYECSYVSNLVVSS